MTIVRLLQKIPFEMCPRTPFFTTYYEQCLFSSFALLIVPMGPSWPHVYARHKTYGFYRTGWPSPLQNHSKMVTFALGLPGGLCRKEPSRRHLGPSWAHLDGILGHLARDIIRCLRYPQLEMLQHTPHSTFQCT